MKEGPEKSEKSYAEKVLNRADIAIKVFQGLGNNALRIYKDENEVKIIVRNEREGIRISYDGLINFVIGDPGLFSEDDKDKMGHITDVKGLDEGSEKWQFKISELLSSKFSIEPTMKIGYTELNVTEIFQLLDRCLDILLKDLKNPENGVVFVTFGDRLRAASDIEE